MEERVVCGNGSSGAVVAAIVGESYGSRLRRGGLHR
jgi:hypothetical protein